MSQTIVANFWPLASPQESDRISSAKTILAELETSQALIKDNSILSDDLQYVCKRLVSGLASSRKAARQGYAMTLAELVAKFECIHVDYIFKLMKENLQVTGSAKAQEERDAFYGQVFALLALCCSGRLLTKDLLPDLKQVVSCLWELGKRKVYLKQICAKGIVDVIGQVSVDDFSQWIFPTIQADLEQGWLQCTPERLSVAVAIQQTFGTEFKAQFFKKQWKHINILNAKNYSRMAPVLMASSYTHPQVHFIWDQILPLVVARPGTFIQFWKTVVDDCMMTSSHERRYLGLQLLLKVVPNLTADQVGKVICGNWMRCLMNNVTLSDRYLHAVTKHVLDGLCQTLSQVSDKSVHLAVVLQLLGPHGNRRFDSVSKTRTVATIINMFDTHATACFVQFLKSTFNEGRTDHNSLLETESCSAATQDIATRQWAIDQMLWLVHNFKLPREDSWLLDIGKFMLFQAFFTVEDAVEGWVETETAPCLPLSPELRQFCLQRFTSVLTELSHMPSLHKDGEGRPKGQHGTMSDGELWLYHLMNFAQSVIQQEGKITLHQPLSSEAFAALYTSNKTVQSIREKALHETNNAESKAFELLFLHTTLQLFSDQDQSVDILLDLQTCYEKLQTSKLKGRKRKSAETSDPEWVEVLTDILLSFLARPSQLTRNVADTVFRAIVQQITKPALGLIVQAVAAKKHRSGEDTDEEEDEEENDDGDDEAVATSEEEEEAASNEDASDTSSENDVDDDDANREFRQKVKTALGNCVAAAETSSSESEHNDDNIGESGDTSMDDEAMEAIDEALAAVFRERRLARKDKKQKQEEKKADTHFKLRVLDLLDIFIKKQSPNPLILDIVLPLLSLIRNGQGHADLAPLVDRAENLFRNKLCKIKEYPKENLDIENTHAILEQLLHIAQTAPSVGIVTLATYGCMLVVRVLRGNEAPNEPSPVRTRATAAKCRRTNEASSSQQTEVRFGSIDVPRFCSAFSSALRNFMEMRNTRLHPVLFNELIDRHPDVSWLLAKDLAETLSSAVNHYRRTQACLMLTQLLSKKSVFEESVFADVCPIMVGQFLQLLQKVDVDVPKTRQLRDMLRFGVKLVTVAKTVNCWNEQLADWEIAINSCQKTAGKSQDVWKLCTQLSKLITEGMPSKTDDPNQGSEEQGAMEVSKADTTSTSPEKQQKRRRRRKAKWTPAI